MRAVPFGASNKSAQPSLTSSPYYALLFASASSPAMPGPASCLLKFFPSDRQPLPGSLGSKHRTATRHYHWMEQDPGYRTIFDQVRLEVSDVLLDEVVRRAMGGLKPIICQGVQVGTRKRYSDRLLMFLLKA